MVFFVLQECFGRFNRLFSHFLSITIFFRLLMACFRAMGVVLSRGNIVQVGLISAFRRTINFSIVILFAMRFSLPTPRTSPV